MAADLDRGFSGCDLGGESLGSAKCMADGVAGDLGRALCGFESVDRNLAVIFLSGLSGFFHGSFTGVHLGNKNAQPSSS